MKKLIIEIDDQTYKAVQLHPECFNFANTILNGKPLQTELEELKKEISDLPTFPFIYNREYECIIKTYVMALMDKKIKELKNEIDK